jgi:signal transduction histidine kinase
MYIAQNIVEDHNGTIRAKSDGEGKGVTFVVEVPINNISQTTT